MNRAAKSIFMRPLEDLASFRGLRTLLRERLTDRGRRYVLVALALGILGLDTRRNQTFLLFAIAFGLVLVACVFAVFARAHARLEVTLPRRATAGRPVRVRATIVPDEGARSSGDALVSFPRGGADLATVWGALTITPRATVTPLDDGPTELTFELVAHRRGRYELESPTLRALDPFGLAAGRARSRGRHALLVYPRFYAMERFDIPLGRRHQPGGIPLTSSIGDAVEFVGTRDYRPGDLLRNVHFRSWAKRGQPVVKEYQEEYFCRLAIVLDTFLPLKSKEPARAAFESAISVVASVADYFSRTEYVVDVLAAGPDLYRVSAGRSLAYLENILDVLACIEPSTEPPFETLAPTVFDELAQITTVVAVLLDWDERRESFLRRVKALGTDVRAIVVRNGPTTLDVASADAALGAIEVMSPEDVAIALEAATAPRVRTGASA